MGLGACLYFAQLFSEGEGLWFGEGELARLALGEERGVFGAGWSGGRVLGEPAQ